MIPKPVVSRIAPTPSGFLHLGNAFNFILTWLITRAAGGSLRLRIDDVDAPRARLEYLADIFESLHWLGLEWDEGPRTVEEHTHHFSQILREERYEELLQGLISTRQVFACQCSRKDIAGQSDDGQYPGTCRDQGLPLDSPDVALRLLTPEDVLVSIEDALLGTTDVHLYAEARDPVLRRRDGIWAYNLVSLSDDLQYEITHIVRRGDLVSTSAVQLYLSQLLGGTSFDAVQFFHHSLMTDDGGGKLSKSAGSNSLFGMREEGHNAADVYARFSAWMDWPSVAHNAHEALAAFKEFGFASLKKDSGLA